MEVINVNIDQLRESPLNPRKGYDEKRMKELAASITERGVMVPLLVRKMDSVRGVFEILGGSRRYRAARDAGVTEVPVQIRAVRDDEEALELAIIDNLEREDLHPLEEAQGFAMLLAGQSGYDVSAVAKRFAKSETVVYQRLQLLKLIEPLQRIFLTNELMFAHAIALARLAPEYQRRTMREGLYREVWVEGPDGAPKRRVVLVNPRELSFWIEREIMLDLLKAPFRKDDRTLVPEAGACTDCPKRTGFVRALFPDVRRREMCTDPGCFRTKLDAYTRQRAEEVAKKVKAGVVKVSTDVEVANKRRTDGVVPVGEFVELAKRDKVCKTTKKAIVVEGSDLGRELRVCEDRKCKIHGLVEMPPEGQTSEQAKRERDTEKRKVLLRRAVAEQVLAVSEEGLAVEDYRLIATAFVREMWGDSRRQLARLLSLKGVSSAPSAEAALATFIGVADATAFNRFLMACAIVRDLTPRRDWDKSPDVLMDAAKLYRIDTKSIAEELKNGKVKKNGKKGAKASGATAKPEAEAGASSAPKAKDLGTSRDVPSGPGTPAVREDLRDAGSKGDRGNVEGASADGGERCEQCSLTERQFVDVVWSQDYLDAERFVCSGSDCRRKSFAQDSNLCAEAGLGYAGPKTITELRKAAAAATAAVAPDGAPSAA